MWVVWDVLPTRTTPDGRTLVELPGCRSRREAEWELSALLRPYPPENQWRRRLRVRKLEHTGKPGRKTGEPSSSAQTDVQKDLSEEP